MANTFTQIYIQIIFAVKNRDALIQPEWEERLYQYITGTVRNKGQKIYAINGAGNHIHFLLSIKPDCCLSDLVREIKKSSNEFVKENKLSKFKFDWQNGFGAFSYSQSQIDKVVKYILNQKEHHNKKSFKSEYLDLLKKFEIKYDEKYLFDWIE